MEDPRCAVTHEAYEHGMVTKLLSLVSDRSDCPSMSAKKGGEGELEEQKQTKDSESVFASKEGGVKDPKYKSQDVRSRMRNDLV